MKDYAMIIRAMGEMEIHSFSCAELPKTCPVEALLPEDKDRADMINWLGAQLDGASAAEVIADDTRRAQVEQMAAYLLSQTEHVPDDDDYVLLLILREKWPVGSKAKFKLKAERVSAEFTYHFLVCPPQKGVTPDDNDALQTAETQSLAAMLPVLKANRKRFAASSGLQQFLQQVAQQR